MAGESQRELLQDALRTIRTLRAENARLRSTPAAPAAGGDVAIVGIGCRFPGGADSPETFLELLRQGRDAIVPVPRDRWSEERYYDADPDAPGRMYVRGGGFLDDIAGFDADFFGIAPREALRLDPQQRLLLEVAWEALEDAGIAPDRLAHSATGAYIGIMAPEYGGRQLRAAHTDLDAYTLTGNDLSFAAGRLAYRLGLQGPALSVATACSSSLVAVHLACQALRAGECDRALAGGVSLMVEPLTGVMLSKLRALSPDGRCKTFDAAADGYGRGEGCGIIVLERAADAAARGHRILALIRGSAVNHDGPSAGLTVPNGPAQEKLLRQALRVAGVEPAAVGFVEAHGTGTPLGDPIELGALARVLGPGRSEALRIGSVKTNLGHLEAAAGIAGLIKAVLALHERQIFPHLHFQRPTPHVPWSELPVRVVTALEEWPSGSARLAGVSSFGISGINAHVVLQEAAAAAVNDAAERPDRLTLSAATEAALRTLAGRYVAHFARHPQLHWNDVCHTARTGRAGLPHAVAIGAASLAEARERLAAWLQGGPAIGGAASAPGGGKVVALPTYSFARQRYWVLDDDAAASPVSPEIAAPEPEEFPAMVARVLGLRQTPDPARSLVDLGLDSLMAIELQAWAKQRRGVELSLEKLLSGATLAQLAELLPASSGDAISESATGPAPGSVLSVGQKALWFIHHSAPESAAYNVGVALRLGQEPDPVALERAWRLLTERHEALRTVYHGRGGEPVAEVLAHGEAGWHVTDARGWNAAELLERVTAAYRIPYDLAAGPLARANLFAGAPGGAVILLTLHHMACDAVSFAVLLRELQQDYAAPFRPLPAPRRYAEFARWQQEMLAGAEGERHWRYWQKQLAGELPVLELPTDRPYPALPSYRGGSHGVALSPAAAAGVRRLAREAKTTPYVVLLASYMALLHRYTGQNDLIVGSAMAARPAGFAETVGYFTNPVPLRADVSGHGSFDGLVGQLRLTVLGALEHQTMPFATLVERLQPRRDPGRPPIFQADFAVLKPPAQVGSESAGLRFEPYTFPEEEGQFELGLHITDDEPGFQATWKYNAELFEAATIEQMARCWLALLESALTDPEQAVVSLRLASPEERERWLAMGRGAAMEFPAETVVEGFERQAAATPEAIAVRGYRHGEDGPAYTYRELNQRANRLARALRECGVGAEAMVGVLLERSPELAVGLLGIAKAGGAFVPLDPRYPAERLRFMIEDSGLRLLVTEPRLAERLGGLPGVRCVAPEQQGDGENLPELPGLEQLAYVIYTSGSTGKPKGTLIPHRGFANYLHWCFEAYPVGGATPVSSSIAFDATLTSIFPALLSGGTAVFLPEEGTIEALRSFLVEEPRLGLVKITPAHLEILNQILPEQLAPAPALVIGGEALRGPLLAAWQERAPGVRLVNEYGPTETVVGCCVYEAREAWSGNVPIGGAIANTVLYVVDSHGEPVPPGVPGELWIGGAGVGRGYLNRPELTAARFGEDPFSPGGRVYRSGDRARFRGDGQLEFLGRLDAQVKIRGHRIEPGEVESVLRLQAAVREAAVVVRNDAAGHPYLAAYMVPAAAADRGTLAAEMRAALAAQLPPAMVPAFLTVIEALPLTAHGKLDRAALPAPHNAPGAAYAAPRDALEVRLAAVWEQVLGVAPIGLRDNFFDLGGHSLRAVQLMSRMQEEFPGCGEAASLSAILRGPTIEQLAHGLRRKTGGSGSALVPIQPAGARTPVYCVPGAGGHAIYLQRLARELGPEQPFFGLQGRGLEGDAAPDSTVEEMAAYYIAALREHQPAGPYRLAGHSLGGWVAAEMAHQLHRAGQVLEPLLILDTPAPAPSAAGGERRGEWDQARWIAELAHRIAQLLDPGLRLDAEELRRLVPEDQMQRFRAALVAADLFPPDASADHLRQVLRVFQAHSQVRYTLPEGRLPAPVILLRTGEPPAHMPALAQDPTWGWGAATTVEVHVLPGEHLSILRPPHVAELGRRMSACLERQALVISA